MSGADLTARSTQHYRILERLGEGGMGEVWKAEDTRLGRIVALKFLPDSVASDSDALRRFESEARLAGNINHPHIVSIFDVGEIEGRRFIAMELVDGGTLRDLLTQQRRLKPREIADYAIQVADA